MNGTMKKRIVAGLLALGMILSPSGAGLTTIPSFAETGASAEAGNGSTDGDETKEGDSDSDGGETDPEDEDGSTDNGEDSSDNGETDPDNDENDSDEDKTEGTAEDAAADESTDGNNLLNASNTEIIGTTDVLEKYGDEVLPNYIIVNSDIFDLPEGFEISENLSVNSYKPTIYSSSEGYNALNAKQKKAYETLLARAEEIDSNEENYGYKYTYTYTQIIAPKAKLIHIHIVTVRQTPLTISAKTYRRIPIMYIRRIFRDMYSANRVLRSMISGQLTTH